MPVQIGQKPESGFNNPLGLLSDCHRRIERFLDVLVRLCTKGAGAFMTPPEIIAMEKALQYFRESGPKHTADEEESLFPRLRQVSGGKAVLKCIEKLETDHETADRETSAPAVVSSIRAAYRDRGPETVSTGGGSSAR
jgi:iron-sulfur cluster repair protein YtfE (RIC family)